LRVFSRLKEHFHVDIGGGCSNNKNLCSRDTDCSSLISQYYFKLAFENANFVDYVTEKYFDALSLPVVPIVMKRSAYKDVVPSESFIAVDDFPNAQKLAEYLNYLIDNPDEYFKYFEWRNNWTWADSNTKDYRQGFCDLCEKLQRNNGSTIAPIYDLEGWYLNNSKCESAVGESWYN